MKMKIKNRRYLTLLFLLTVAIIFYFLFDESLKHIIYLGIWIIIFILFVGIFKINFKPSKKFHDNKYLFDGFIFMFLLFGIQLTRCLADGDCIEKPIYFIVIIPIFMGIAIWYGNELKSSYLKSKNKVILNLASDEEEQLNAEAKIIEDGYDRTGALILTSHKLYFIHFKGDEDLVFDLKFTSFFLKKGFGSNTGIKVNDSIIIDISYPLFWMAKIREAKSKLL